MANDRFIAVFYLGEGIDQRGCVIALINVNIV